MTHSMSFGRFALLPAVILVAAASTACSTTRVEAAKPAVVTVVSPAPWVAPSPVGDIATVVLGTGQFVTLMAAVNAAGLYSALTGTGPITVFAPTDAAFAKLPYGTVERLLKPENRDALRQLVSYHVMNGRVQSVGLMGKVMTSPTLEGMSVSIDGRNGVRVNNALVTQPDMEASNGLVHAIDTVLMPSNMIALR
jgi:uncharacterized surface protein with fasciclin (FAS1) repeats